MNFIQITDLSFRYPGAEVDSLRNVNLTIEKGDFVAVVGGNGSGKTTLCKTLNGMIPHYWSGEFAGDVRVNGIDTFDSTVAELSRTVGYVYQDFQNQLVRPTVRDEVAFGPVNYGLEDFGQRRDEALSQLGIEGLSERFVWQLSGGQAHLVALASVLALRPEVIIVDEPVAELDPARAEETYRQLEKLNREVGTTIIAIEHHAEFIARYASSVILMNDGAPVWHLPVREAMARAGELESHGIPAPTVTDIGRRIGVGQPALTVAEAADQLRQDGLVGTHDMVPDAAASPTVSSGATNPSNPPIRGHTANAAADSIARLQGVRHGYRSVGGSITPVLDGIDLTLHEGERVAVVGSNGAGKSTLLKLLTGLIVPRSGTVEVCGVNTRKRSAAQLADLVSYLYQHPERMFLTESVRKDVELFPTGRRIPDAEAIATRVIDRVNLGEMADRDGRALSGGQQRRATIAIGLAMRPRVLLLDEPTASLDIRSRDGVIGMLAELADTIRCAVVATHDMQLVADWATRVLVMGEGTVLADVTPRELFADVDLVTRARLVPPQVAQLGVELGMDPVPLSVDELVDRLATVEQKEQV